MDECCTGAIQAPGTLSLKADMAGDLPSDLTLCHDYLCSLIVLHLDVFRLLASWSASGLIGQPQG